MTKQRPGLTPAEHAECGRLILQAREALMQAAAMVCKAYGASSPASKALHRAIRPGCPIDKAKCNLDDLIFAEVPRDRDPRGLAMCVYYGEGLAPCSSAGSEADAFAGYAQPRGCR